MTRIGFAAGLLGLSLVLAGASLAAEPAAGALPSAAPAPTLTDLDGRPGRLEDLLGQERWTVVMFWASDCGVCNQEAPGWVLFDERWRSGGARVVGVTLDGRAGLAAARAFRDRHRMGFPNLLGEPEDVARMFTERARQPWLGTPSFLVYGPGGELRARHVGALPPGRLEEYLRKQAARPAK